MRISSLNLKKLAQLTFSLARRASLSAWRALRTLLNSLFWVTDHPVLKWGVLMSKRASKPYSPSVMSHSYDRYTDIELLVDVFFPVVWWRWAFGKGPRKQNMSLALLHHIKGFLIIIEGNRHRCDRFHIYYRIRVSADERKQGWVASLKHRERLKTPWCHVMEKVFDSRCSFRLATRSNK